MKNIINKIKSFLKNFFRKNDTKLLNEAINDEKTNDLVKTEIEIKNRNLEEITTEMEMFRKENMSDEKHRIMDLYYKVQDGEVDIESIEYEDLIIIRKLLLEEAKMRDVLIDEDFVELVNLVSKENVLNS